MICGNRNSTTGLGWILEDLKVEARLISSQEWTLGLIAAPKDP